MKDDCIFCKLANGIFDTNALYEDDTFKIIFDISPATEGHVLILPKEHYANIFELPEEVVSKAFILAKKVAFALKEATGCKGVNILQNNGEAAGQTVFHFHVHVIPRYNEKIISWKAGELDNDAVARITAAVEKYL